MHKKHYFINTRNGLNWNY